MKLIGDQESIFTDGPSQRNLLFLNGDWISNDLVKWRRNVHSKEFHVKKGLTLARTCLIPFSMFPYIHVMLFLNFSLQKKHHRQMHGQLELVRKDVTFAKFRATDSYRLKTRFTSSLEHRTWVTGLPVALATSSFIGSSIQHSARHRAKLIYGPSKAQLSISFTPKKI